MAFPHQYTASASAQAEGNVSITGNHLPEILSNAPAEFGGPGDQWSPEDLLVAAVADCFALSFRAIATASKFEWTSLTCEVTGTLDKVERAVQFTELQVKAKLTVPAGSDTGRANRLLEKAEQACFITNSLKSTPHLEAEIVTG